MRARVVYMWRHIDQSMRSAFCEYFAAYYYFKNLHTTKRKRDDKLRVIPYALADHALFGMFLTANKILCFMPVDVDEYTYRYG